MDTNGAKYVILQARSSRVDFDVVVMVIIEKGLAS